MPLLDQIQCIEELSLSGYLNYFNVDNLVNLKAVCLSGLLSEDFNFEIFKNISNQLEDLAFYFDKIDYEIFVKLLNGHNFSYLLSLHIDGCNMRIIKKNLLTNFILFSNLVSLVNLKSIILLENPLKFIEVGIFSHMKYLKNIYLNDIKLNADDFNTIQINSI